MPSSTTEASPSPFPSVIPWMPQKGPQEEAIKQHGIDEIFFGGAVGGGKSDFLLGDFAQDIPNYGSAWRGILFRKTYGELEELIQRSQEIYPPWWPGAEWRASDKTWYWPNGAFLRLRYLESSADWMRYWGHQYTWQGWDELPLWSDLVAYHKLKARLRSAQHVPNKRIRSTGNPGGPGHQAVKAYWQIDRYPQGGHIIRDETTGTSRMFIRSRVQDNRILTDSDPGYMTRLHGLGSKALVRAWLDGDWNVVVGAYFDCWSEQMIIRPVELPGHWLRFRSMDWGSARPFSVGWWAVASEPLETEGGLIPKGAMIRYREWYGSSGEPNEGVKLHAEVVGKGIAEREDGDAKISYGVLDPSAFAQDGGPSIAERILRGSGGKIMFRPADNKRVAEKGRQGGWDQMRARMIGEDGRPMIYCFNTCTDSIRTIPALQHDENKPEDVDTDGEDHAGDEWRYACMSRPYTRPKPGTPKPVFPYEGKGQMIIGNVPIRELIRRKERAARED